MIVIAVVRIIVVVVAATVGFNHIQHHTNAFGTGVLQGISGFQGYFNAGGAGFEHQQHAVRLGGQQDGIGDGNHRRCIHQHHIVCSPQPFD